MIFKLIKWAVILVVLVVVGGIAALYLSLGGIVKSVVQKEGTAQLNVPTTLGSASVGLTSGSIGFKDFALGSPTGFTAPHMLDVGSLSVATTGITHLRDQPLHVTDITLASPKLVLEQKGMKLNVKALMDGLPPAGEPSPNKADANPLRLIIDKMAITGATVDVVPDAGGLVGGAAGNALGGLGGLGQQASALAQKQADKAVKPMSLTLPDLTLQNVGNADGKGKGVEVKDVVAAILQAMATEAAKQHDLPIPAELLQGDFKGKVGDALQDQIKKQAGKLPGNAGDLLNGVLGGGKR